MKKIALFSTVAGYLAIARSVSAEAFNIKVNSPNGGVNPTTQVGTVFSNVITIIFVVAVLAVLFMLITGAFAWITSGGDKEAVGKARSRILNALIGLAVLAVAFLIANVAGKIVNIDIFNISVPTLDGR